MKFIDMYNLLEEEKKKEDRRTLFVERKLLNPKDLIDWAKNQGFKTTLPPEDLHVTIMFSKEKVDWNRIKPDKDIIGVKGGLRKIKPLGDEGAIVLRFDSETLQERWKHLRKRGCSWDYPSYQPHVTITYDAGDIDLLSVEPYSGVIFLDNEIFKEVDPDWVKKIKEE